MAEQIPYDVASSLINRLASAAFHEFGRIYGVVDELERLKNTVESIRAVLLDAEEKQEQNHAVQNWIRRLKDVLHPADDLVDEFFIQEMKHKVDAHHHHKNKVTEVLHSFSPKQIVSRHKLAGQIEKIRKTFNDVVGEMSMLNLIPNVYDKQTNINERWETTSFIFEQDIIGRIDDKKEIISLLEKPHSHDGQNVSLIAIVGIGGLGKTALAQLVYNDVKVQKCFEKKMWVCVSDNFDVKTIVKKMSESLTNSKVDDNLSLENLQNKLREHLTGKRYLLVLDDTWNESHQKWNQLRTYLMCGAPDSKVLVTTRKKIVAQTMGVSVSYALSGLTIDESWSLLKKISFVEDVTSGVNQSLESIGKKIAEKCKGVPLAIRTLAGLLQSKSKESEWIDVLRSEFWRLCEDEESIMPVLKRSYQNLSPQLRQCFAYCSLYPKDWVIRKDELIQLWMAQGYLECSTENQSMEDLGNQFIKTFLMKSFFQDVEMSPLGDIASFKMEDFNNDNYSLHSHHLPLPPFPPRLSLLSIYDCPMLTLMPTFPSLDKKLELVDCSVEILKATINTPFDFPPLSKLNSLYIGGSQLHVSQFPKDWAPNLTTSLRELEILRFSNQQIQEMEMELDCLQNISFDSCKELEALPDWMCNLSSLQHIKVENCECLKSLPEGMSRLTNLQTLEIFDCPLLVEECQTETSATWPQISHIPNIIMH